MCVAQGQLRSKSNTKTVLQILLTLNTKMAFLASWPLAVAILMVRLP